MFQIFRNSVVHPSLTRNPHPGASAVASMSGATKFIFLAGFSVWTELRMLRPGAKGDIPPSRHPTPTPPCRPDITVRKYFSRAAKFSSGYIFTATRHCRWVNIVQKEFPFGGGKIVRWKFRMDKSCCKECYDFSWGYPNVAPPQLNANITVRTFFFGQLKTTLNIFWKRNLILKFFFRTNSIPCYPPPSLP